MRITRVYTRTGDNGSTRLVGGQSILKDDIRIEAFGTIDELNCAIGHARHWVQVESKTISALQPLDEVLARIQNDLFRIGGDLATLPEDRWEGMERVTTDDTAWLESQCDAFNDALPPLKEFILPGGGQIGCWMHTARTTCRRAERRLTSLEQLSTDSTDASLPYINRLSDLLFILGRWSAQATDHPTTTWARRT